MLRKVAGHTLRETGPVPLEKIDYEMDDFMAQQNMPTNYVVDTCIFNWLVDQKMSRSDLPDGLVATHIQVDEINQTPDAERRARLFLMFAKCAPEIKPTESGIWGSSRWGEAKWSDGNRLNKIISLLDKKRRNPNNHKDALIGEVALVNGYGLITADSAFASVMEQLGVHVVFFRSDSAKAS